jgi:hypothetical protein
MVVDIHQVLHDPNNSEPPFVERIKLHRGLPVRLWPGIQQSRVVVGPGTLQQHAFFSLLLSQLTNVITTMM